MPVYPLFCTKKSEREEDVEKSKRPPGASWRELKISKITVRAYR